jgi:hypothetical protein
MSFHCSAYLGSYRLIQSLQDKPALLYLEVLMLAYGYFLSLRKEKINEIDKEIIKKNLSLFIKGFIKRDQHRCIGILDGSHYIC